MANFTIRFRSSMFFIRDNEERDTLHVALSDVSNKFSALVFKGKCGRISCLGNWVD